MPSLKTRPQVIIVDDDAQVRRLQKDYLSEEHDCRDVASAEDALSVPLRLLTLGGDDRLE